MESKNVNELEDFKREIAQKQFILETPCISREFIFKVKESAIGKRIREHYENFTLSKFLEHTSVKKN